MMSDVNWWLMATAFVLGLVIAFFLMIDRVKREVPIYESLGRGSRVDGAAAAGGASATGSAAKGKEPYGAGSIRVAPTADSFDRFTVKGNEDSMLYHTSDSPSYKQTIAEIWFVDEESAVRGGFQPWHKGKGSAAAGVAAAGGAAMVSTFADTGTAKAEAATEEPYGAGSLRVAATATAPSGYTVKGNEDSMLYHTTESPSYKQTIAEIWFRDVESAERAGFARWDSGKSQRGKK
jgi:hypothetical protein